jgi:hypothetical protein
VDSTEALRLVVRIYTRLNARRPEIEKREKYYGGEQPLSFATQEWRRENAERYSGFSDNWSAPVVSAESERIRYTGMTFASANDTDPLSKAGTTLHEHWLANEMDMQASQGFVTTLTTGRSFVIVWGDKITDQPVVTWEHPSNVEIEYDWANPRIRKAALKTWVDETTEYATLYTPDSIWKYERPKTKITTDLDSQAKQSRSAYSSDGGWMPRETFGETWPLHNPIGEVPVVEIQNRPTLKGDPISEIAGVMPMQDAINLLWAYLFLAADYASMDARVVLGSGPPMIPIIDQNPTSPTFGKKFGEKPVEMKELREKRLLYLTDPEAKIDSWKAAQLDIFTNTIDIAVGHISSQTRTPPTYLVTKTGMSNVNGDGLKASEIGLNKKVEEFWTFAGPALREVNRLIALAMGDEKLAQATRLAKVNHMNPEIRSEAQLADMLVKKKAIGYPLEYLMELDGIDPLDIPRILNMAKEEAEANLQFGVNEAMNAQAAPDVAAE